MYDVLFPKVKILPRDPMEVVVKSAYDTGTRSVLSIRCYHCGAQERKYCTDASGISVPCHQIRITAASIVGARANTNTAR